MKYNKEVICDNSDGRVYDYRCPEQLTEIISEFVLSPHELLKMRKNARQRAFEYEPKVAITSLLNNITNK